MSTSSLLKLRGLTDAQREAVEHVDGPLLILAGPGSGKTRVVTHRIARLCERAARPHEILAITFTNKAANEMAERVARLLPGERVWISTFHRFCARLLRRRAEAVGLQPNYTILDTTDQTQLLKQVLKDEDIDATAFPPRKIAARISNEKNDLRCASDVAAKFADSVGNHFEAVVARVYPEYQRRLLQSNAVDFDDLLLHVVTLLDEHPELRRQLGERYRYILVDEYQDTNLAQYRIVSALASEHHNLCVTGDPDQSIYGWRGARIDNILRFERDFPDARVVRLEQNFRSTKHILKAADDLIANNTQRKAKSLLTENPVGDPVECHRFRDGLVEADEIAKGIRHAVEEEGSRIWSDFALFYRVNALSRELERALMRHNVPFQVAAGFAFYERAEIKDVLAYLRLIVNPDDETAFRRIVNVPKRHIGRTTVEKLAGWAAQERLSLLEAAARSEECPWLKKRAVTALQKFAALIGALALETTDGVAGLLRMVLDRTAYGLEWKESDSEQDQQRLANVQELITAARQYDAGTDDPTLEGFLETTALVSDVDNLEDDAGCVTLMTLHAAKGLEFPVVYIVGVEQNLIPHERSLKTGDFRELEEERRLLFVGMTRAREQLVLTHTWQREFRGRTLHTIASDFLPEIPLTLRDRIDDGDIDAPSRTPRRTRTKKRRANGPRLTTAADLLNGTPAEADLASGFAVGSIVRHPRYGTGEVIDVGGFARRRILTVAFEDGRRETFVADKSPLHPVGPH